MTSRRRIVAAALPAVVLIAALAVLVSNMTARAAEVERVDVVLDFTGLVPGVERTVTYPVDVPVNAQIAESGFISVTGVAEQIDWTIDLCSTQSCRDITDGAAGSLVAPGNYTLRVSAVLTEDVTGEGEALGRVRLVAVDNTLPATGTTVAWVTSIVAGIAVLLGLVTLLGSRRREAPPMSRTRASLITAVVLVVLGIAASQFVPTQAAWNDTAFFTAAASTGTWLGNGDISDGGISVGNATTVISDIAWTVPSPNRFCVVVTVTGTSSTPQPWQLDIDLTRSPFNGVSVADVTVRRGEKAQGPGDTMIVTGTTRAGRPFNPRSNNTPITDAQEAIPRLAFERDTGPGRPGVVHGGRHRRNRG